MQRRGPIEGPYGRPLTRRVTWRSSTYRIMSYLYILGVLYIIWLLRDFFYRPLAFLTTAKGRPAMDGPKGVSFEE